MKIAQVVSTFPPYKGGMGNMAYSYALGMTELGHHVEVFCPRFNKIENEVENPFKVHRLIPFGKFRNSAFLPQLFSRLHDFDIVDLHYPFYGGAESVFLRKKLTRNTFKLVINFQMDNFGRGIPGALFKIYSACFSKTILLSGDQIIVTSNDYAVHSSISSLFTSKRDIFTAIPPGIDITKFKPATKEPALLKKYGLSNQDPLVLFVGRLDRAHAFKGIDLLIEAWSTLDTNETRLLIVGQGDMREAHIRKSNELGVSHIVTFADPVEDHHLPHYYNLADLLILPSVNSAEAFGIVLIEAMACGVPVLASDLPGVRQVVSEGNNGDVFRPGNRQEMTRKIRAILGNDKLRGELGQNARKSALERYSQEIVWRRLEKLYLELIEN